MMGRPVRWGDGHAELGSDPAFLPLARRLMHR